MNRRKVQVPGEPLEVSTILTDAAHNAVLSIAHGGRMVVVFTSSVGKPTARSMTVAEAREFTASVVGAFEALNDDAKIKEMEKEFEDGQRDG